MTVQIHVQASVSIYPLGQAGFEAVHRAIAALENANVEVEPGNMHTIIRGSDTAVFAALQAAFAAAAELGGTVLTATVSNACPV